MEYNMPNEVVREPRFLEQPRQGFPVQGHPVHRSINVAPIEKPFLVP